ncbi:DoxX family protein [Halorussus caseinilyticus]|uniref:DoxX family protein n=1 Tax=Halorussus caseinilyticus TaxID=3034025 RepID=A0ABD5WST9_9EURY|nr:DoxX family protein [Halorussus sp. DT72]
MAVETVSSVAFLVGRVLFGGVLAFTGVNHFLQADQMAGYAEAKGAPAPTLSVYGSGVLLVLGGASIVLGAFPLVGAAALVGFLVVATPMFHDFWSVEDPQQRQQEMTDFLKNVALIGGALVLLAVSGGSWPFAVGL